MKRRIDLNTLMRAGHLRRWHMVRVAVDQTLADHVACVQIIAREVLDRINATDELIFRTMEWAFWHDMPEVVTGDIAPPFKRMMDREAPGVIQMIDRSIDDRYRDAYDNAPPVAVLIVEFADLLDAARFIRSEGVGRRAHEIYMDLCISIIKLESQTEDIDAALARAMQKTREEMNLDHYYE